MVITVYNTIYVYIPRKSYTVTIHLEPYFEWAIRDGSSQGIQSTQKELPRSNHTLHLRSYDTFSEPL